MIVEMINLKLFVQKITDLWCDSVLLNKITNAISVECHDVVRDRAVGGADDMTVVKRCVLKQLDMLR